MVPRALLRRTQVALLVALPLSPLPGAADPGSEWRWQNPLPQGDGLRAIWGAGPDRVFAVGEGGIILAYDGTAWSIQGRGGIPGQILSAVWGTSESDVFAVGMHATVMHYDGNAWSTRRAIPTGEWLYGVWGSSGDDVFAVGDNGKIAASTEQAGGGSAAGRQGDFSRSGARGNRVCGCLREHRTFLPAGVRVAPQTQASSP